MKVKALRDTYVIGEPVCAGSVVSIEDTEAKYLCGLGTFEKVEDQSKPEAAKAKGGK